MVKQLLTGTSMLFQFDALLVTQSNRFAAWLQEEHEQSMPGILSHAATATIACTLAAIGGMLVMRTPMVAAIMLLFGSMTVVSLIPLVKRYQRDAERGWSQGLAREYAVRAIGAQEGQRSMRVFGLALVMFVFAISCMRSRPNDVVDLITLMLVFASVAHLYLACAEPKPPGTRRQEDRRLALQGAR